MISAVLTAPKQIEIRQRSAITPAPNEALVEVSLAGVCGTDLAIWSGNYPTPLPLVLGHEFVGRVVEVGDPTNSFFVGRRVTAEINNTCRSLGHEKCAVCASGLESHCASRTVTGIISRDGAFAEYILVPVENLHTVPDEIPDQEAVFIEPLAAALQTFEMAPLQQGDSVVILGAGRLGYLIAGVAKALGADVLVAAHSAEKIERADKFLGVQTHRLESEDALADHVKIWTNGLGASHVVEATGFGHGSRSQGNPLDLALRLVRPQGVIDLKSTPGEAMPCIPLTKIVVDEIRLQGSRCGPFDKAIDLLAKRPFPVSNLIAEEYSLRETSRALERASQVSKVVIQCQPSHD